MSEYSPTRLSWEDIVIVVLYFIAVIVVGLYASCRGSGNNVEGYFLAGKSMNFLTVGASLFVSNIGSEHFIGLAGSGAAGGIGVGAWEFNAIFLIQLLGFVFVPVYIACQAYTMPEYMNKRFGGQRIRVYFALLSLVLYIFTKCSVNLYTGALFIQQSLGWDIYLSILLQIGIVFVLTVTGGLTAVIYTDTFQAVLMIAGALGLMAKGFYDIGGFNELWRRYPLAVTNLTVPNTTCHEINPNWNVMLRGPSDPEMPWPGFLLGQTPGSIWYWCSDQVIVQRAIAAKSLSHAQAATLLAGFAKILPLFMMVMPGMMARVLYTDEVACVDPDVCYKTCESRTGCTNIAYPKLVLGIMPTGARGVMMAVVLAALMSDLDSIFNSASTLFTIDIYKRVRPKASTTEEMIVGRLFVGVMAGVAIAWVPIVKSSQGGQLFIYIQEISLYLSPPVACIYLLAILWPRCNEKGAFWGLVVGFVTGVLRLILVFVYPTPESCGEEDTRPSILRDFHYMYFAIMLFWLTCGVAVVVSLLTEPPSYKQLYRTTYWSRFEKVTHEEMESGQVMPSWDRMNCCFKATLPKHTQTYDNQLDIADEDLSNGGKAVDMDDVTGGITSGVNGVNGVEEHELETVVQDAENGEIEEGLGTDDEKRATPTPPPKRNWKQFWFSWFCGIAPEGAKLSEDELRVAREREEKIASLAQDPLAKFVLDVLLVVILCIGVTLYTFWSLWRYTVPSDEHRQLLYPNISAEWKWQ